MADARRAAVKCRSCLIVLLSAVAAVAGADDNLEKTAAGLITPQTQAAIDRGLRALARRQHEDGSFGDGHYEGNVAITALAGMAFLSNGSTPGRGPYGEHVNRSVAYLLAQCRQSGFIVAPGAASHGPMYGHGFATLYLAECYGMSPRPELREKLAKAVALIIDTQNPQGGWRYQPQRADADISVTVCEVMALRAARNAGLHVPRETIDNAVEYVKKSQNPDGGFMYQLGTGVSRDSGFGRSAAGVVALYSAGVYEGPEINAGLDYLTQFVPTQGKAQEDAYYFYSQYYAVQAMWQAGDERWGRWYPAVRDELVELQRKEDGAWFDLISVDYGTAMALIVLQMPNDYLPIFQR